MAVYLAGYSDCLTGSCGSLSLPCTVVDDIPVRKMSSAITGNTYCYSFFFFLPTICQGMVAGGLVGFLIFLRLDKMIKECSFSGLWDFPMSYLCLDILWVSLWYSLCFREVLMCFFLRQSRFTGHYNPVLSLPKSQHHRHINP